MDSDKIKLITSQLTVKKVVDNTKLSSYMLRKLIKDGIIRHTKERRLSIPRIVTTVCNKLDVITYLNRMEDIDNKYITKKEITTVLDTTLSFIKDKFKTYNLGYTRVTAYVSRVDFNKYLKDRGYVYNGDKIIKEWLNVKEISTYISMSEDYIRKLFRDGVLTNVYDNINGDRIVYYVNISDLYDIIKHDNETKLKYYTVKEACSLLKLKLKRSINKIVKGEKPLKLSRTTLYLKENVLKLIKHRRN